MSPLLHLEPESGLGLMQNQALPPAVVRSCVLEASAATAVTGIPWERDGNADSQPPSELLNQTLCEWGPGICFHKFSRRIFGF